MRKLIVADFDGTLLPYGDKTVSAKTISQIKDVLSKGAFFAVASGRTYSELSVLLRDVSSDIYFICNDGALTVKNDTAIYKKQFSFSALATFFDDDIYKSATFYSLDKAYLIGNVEKPVLYGKTPCKISRRFEINDDVFKVTAFAKRFDIVSNNDFRVHYSDGYFAEFVPAYANKGLALAQLQLKLGISKFDTVVIGDAGNDIPMVSHAKRSWAIGNDTRTRALRTLCTDSAVGINEALDVIIKDL